MSQEGMIEKLRLEITQLEHWLEAQHASGFKTSRSEGVSLIPTIETLIRTRRQLLSSLEASPGVPG